MAAIRAVEPRTRGCARCLEERTGWVHLRICLICGEVGCCNASPGRHALRHFLETGHPLVQSLERGDEWAFCYADELFLLPQIAIRATWL
jgi:uncharacterized UBP type Zn finger protein